MKWEYRVIRVLATADFDPAYYNAAEELHDAWGRLHAEGQEGWELVSVDSGVAYFKRAISEQESSYFTPEYFDKINEMAMKQFAQAIVEVPTKQSYDD